MAVEPDTREEAGAPNRRPALSALANVRAARLGIGLPSWQQALREHLARSARHLSAGP